MNMDEARALDDDAEVIISGRDLKVLLEWGLIMNSGLAPKGEMCFMYGKGNLAIVERATVKKETT